MLGNLCQLVNTWLDNGRKNYYPTLWRSSLISILFGTRQITVLRNQARGAKDVVLAIKFNVANGYQDGHISWEWGLPFTTNQNLWPVGPLLHLVTGRFNFIGSSVKEIEKAGFGGAILCRAIILSCTSR